MTINLKPRLASQAPKVNKMILIVDNSMLIVVRERGIIATRVNIMPSRENNDIRKCWRWRMNVKVIA